MRVDDYQRQALGSDQSQGKATARYLLLGLFGEAGGVLTAVKKRERDDETTAKYLEEVTEELGDLLWYFAAVSAKNGVALSTLAAPLLKSPGVRRDRIEFADIQQIPTQAFPRPSKFLELRLVRLASAVGTLVRLQTASLHPRTKDSTNFAFTNVLKRLVYVANRVGISLDDVAAANLKKVRDRWPTQKVYPTPLDDVYPDFERLPRKMTIDIREVTPSKDQYFVLQTCNGLHIGDRLTDNIGDADEYRFHDVFHYAYVAVLGWSPVMRSLLRLKRKSNKIGRLSPLHT